MRYRNPVIPGFYPDPSICRVKDDYYLVTSSFEYFPGVPIFHSRDLVNWRQIGYCLSRPSQLPLNNAWISGGIFAPTLRYHGGLYYMITTNTSDGGTFYVTATNPAGPWSDPVWIDQDGIDPDLFFDDDGAVYVTSSGRSGGRCTIVQSRLDLTTGRLRDANREIWQGTGALGPEGPHLYKIGGTYYLMIAEGGTEYGHMEVIARGQSPSGPWEPCPYNPILTHRSSANPIQAVGHADLIQAANGSWWAVFLGIRPYGYHRCHNLGRETFLAPVQWKQGWPHVGNRGMAEMEMEGPLPELHPWPAEPTRDHFDKSELGLCWNCIRNPQPGYWSLTERPGWLALHGPAADLNNMQPVPNFLGRRQCHQYFRAATLLDFEPAYDNEEAGVTVFQNMWHHYEAAVSHRYGERVILVRRRIGTLQAIVACEPIPSGPIEIVIRAVPEWYRFSFVGSDGGERFLAEGEARYLSTEVGGRFTGVYVGLYATGNGKPCTVPAYFDWFDYVPEENSSETKT